MTNFAVIGIEHLHVFELVQGLLDAGAIDAGYAPAGSPHEDGRLLDLYGQLYADSPRRSADEILADPAIDLVVLAGVPSERTDLAIAAMATGKSVLSDKPGATTRQQIAATTEAQQQTGQRWWVLFSERFTNRAISEAIRQVHAGEIGRVVDVIGLGPHTLAADNRPDWFWWPESSGGIIGDIGSHQVDQLCAIVDPDCEGNVYIESATVSNVACADHPAMQDLGRFTLRFAGPDGSVFGSHRVDYLSPAGLDTWGDCRLMITGTEGTLEVRANIDPAGAAGAEHLIKVDAAGTHRVDCSAVAVDWADRLLADLQHGTDTLMSAKNTARVCQLALHAQEMAQRIDERTAQHREHG